jgi:murein DD-endopeptidase MepM/ murein hydrolase activator NlpD
MKSKLVFLSSFALLLLAAGQVIAGETDPDTIWPLCGRITENPPPGWRKQKGCPESRFGNPAYSDAPFSATFGPRPLGSENDRYDFHRGVDIPTPIGTPIFAIADGNVEIAGNHSSYSDPLIKLRHYRPGFSTCTSGAGCYHSFYLHVDDWVVAEDDSVEKGQLIGYSGASGASGFAHVHFEVRDAPAFDVFSAWSRDAVHPFGVVPYAATNNTSIIFNSVDATDVDAITAEITVTSNRYDLVAVSMTVFDANQQSVTQPGDVPDANGYLVHPSAFDMELGNFMYSHKNSSGYPWSSYGQGGANECPYHADHGSSYNGNVHLDAQDPADFHNGQFNGVHIQTNKYWNDDHYWLNLEFQQLVGPAECIEATTLFASGDTTTAQWGACSGSPNLPPVAAFSDDCNALSCDFDGSASVDNDGSIENYAWDFGDGNGASGALASHTFNQAGTFPVTLTVTDNGGASASVTRSITVEEPTGSNISLALSTNRKRNKITLTWSGAAGSRVDIIKNGAVVTTTKNDGNWGDRAVEPGNSYSYQVCETGNGGACSVIAGLNL